MEKTYNMTENVMLEINTLIDEFYEEIDNTAGKLIFLEIIDKVSCDKKDFLSQFINVHQELRTGSINKIRHFILMKRAKLNKDIRNKIPLLDIIDTFPAELQENYWNMIHLIYIILESLCTDTKEEIINTLKVEIEKRAHIKVTDENTRLEKIEHEKNIAKARLSNEAKRESKMPDLSEMMKHMDDNPEIMDMFAQMTGTQMTTSNMSDILKKALGDNPEMATMLTTAIATMKDPNAMENLDVMSMIGQFMPDLDMSCNTNIVLVNKIYKDIVFIFSTDDDKNTTIKERVSTKVVIYRDLISSEKISVSEMAACLMRIITNEEMKEYIINMEKTEVSIDIIISLAFEFLPKDMIEKFGSMDVIKNMLGDMGSDDIGKMMDMFGNSAPPVVENEQLTEAQELELEKYYDEHY